MPWRSERWRRRIRALVFILPLFPLIEHAVLVVARGAATRQSGAASLSVARAGDRVLVLLMNGWSWIRATFVGRSLLRHWPEALATKWAIVGGLFWAFVRLQSDLRGIATRHEAGRS